jgi:hypothetical protein
MNPKKRIGEMLLEAGIIDETQLKAALGHQRQWGVRLGQALVDLKLATESDVVRALSLKFGFEVANLGALEPYGHEQALKLFPREFTVRNNVFPMWADTANVTVAMSDPTNLAVADEIRFRTGRRVKVCIGGDREIAAALKRLTPTGDGGVEAIALDLDGDAGVEGEAVFDPFGGGSKDALEAFFGGEKSPPSAPPAAARARPLEPDLEGAAFAAALEQLPEAIAEELTPLDDGPQNEPILASDLAPEGDRADGTEESRDLTPRELAILESLDRLADGAPAEPDVIKPTQAVAAMIRLLIRKRIVSEQDFLDELSKK